MTARTTSTRGAHRDRRPQRKQARRLSDEPRHTLDATKTGEMDKLFEEAGWVAKAVNCVGSFVLDPVHMTPEEERAEVMALNFDTAFGTVKTAAKHMLEGSSVVLLSPVVARGRHANRQYVPSGAFGRFNR